MICPKHSKLIRYFAISEKTRQADEDTFRCEECILLQPGGKKDPNEKLISVLGTVEDTKNEVQFMKKKIGKNIEKVVQLHHTEVNEFNQQINELIEELVKRLIVIKHVNFKLLETWIKENEQQINKHFFTDNTSKTIHELSQIISNPAFTPQQVKSYFDSYLKQIRTVDLISSLRYNSENINFFKGYLSEIASLVKEFDTSFTPNAIKFFTSRSSINIESQIKCISQQFVQQQQNYFDYMLKRCSEIKRKSQPEYQQDPNPKSNIIEEFIKFKTNIPAKENLIDVSTQMSSKKESSNIDKKQPNDLKKKIIITLNKHAPIHYTLSQPQFPTFSQEPQLNQNQQVNGIINNSMQNPHISVDSSPEVIGSVKISNKRPTLLQDKSNEQSEKIIQEFNSQSLQNNYGEISIDINNSMNNQELIEKNPQQQAEIKAPQQLADIQIQQNSNGMSTPTQKNLNSISLHQQNGTPMLSTPFSVQESPLSYPQSHSYDLFHKYADSQIPSYSTYQRQEEVSNFVNDNKLSESEKIVPKENTLSNQKGSDLNPSESEKFPNEIAQLQEIKEQIQCQTDNLTSSENGILQISLGKSKEVIDEQALTEDHLPKQTTIIDICQQNDNSQDPQINLGDQIDFSNENQLQSPMIQDESVVMDEFPDILNNLPNILDSLSNVIDPQPSNADENPVSAFPSCQMTDSKNNGAGQILLRQSSVEKQAEIIIEEEQQTQANQETDQQQLQQNTIFDSTCPSQETDKDISIQPPSQQEQQQDQKYQLPFTVHDNCLNNQQSPALQSSPQKVADSNINSQPNSYSISEPINSSSLISQESPTTQTQSNEGTNQTINEGFSDQIPLPVPLQDNTIHIALNLPIDNSRIEYPQNEKGEVAVMTEISITEDIEKENERTKDSKKSNDIALNHNNSLSEINISENPVKSKDTQEYVDNPNENQLNEHECNQIVKNDSFECSLPSQRKQKIMKVENAKEKIPIRIFSLENSVNKKRSYNQSQSNSDTCCLKDFTSKKIIIETVEERSEEAPLQLEINPIESNLITKTMIFRGKRVIKKLTPSSEDTIRNKNKRIVQVETITQREEIEQISNENKLEQSQLFISQPQDSFKVFKTKFACLEKRQK